MKIFLSTLAFLAIGLVRCGGDKSILVGDERSGSGGSGGVAAGGGVSGGSGTPGSAGFADRPPNGGGARGGMDNGGPGGGPAPNCMAMAREYRDHLIASQLCMPVAPDPCTLVMPDDLLCGCPAYVNPERDLDVRRMNELLDISADCPHMCPPGGCRPVSFGQCMVDPSSNPPRGNCVSVP
ncbi:MAG TPA: hypothetical protein VMS65_09730 [Polyangiaceae bacterium]|nr:hypothetical protein [Polyangiaceae bacterium]